MFFNNDWDMALSTVIENEAFNKLLDFVRGEYNNECDFIYPPKNKVFRCFKLTPYRNVKVVILGQDPYHERGQANGLCFSVNDGIKLPPSLVNIYKELANDYNCKINMTGDLSLWARQGVLLLNAVLTVKDGKACSHANMGWEFFTDEVIKAINNKKEPVVFILWGNYARNKSKLITNSKHFIIESAHPSPLSAHNGFFGSKPFSKCNNFLKKFTSEINWIDKIK